MDFMHDKTEKELKRLEQSVTDVYTQASKDLAKKSNEFFERFKKNDIKQREMLKKGIITDKEYKKWMKGQITRGEQYKALQESYARTLTNSNIVAQNIINGKMTDIFMINSNYMGSVLEYNTGMSFAVYNEQTVKRLIQKEPNLLPFKKVNETKSIRWNKKQVSRQITQGILQGESIDKIADRLSNNIPEMNKNSALTNARTAVTNAQNSGRAERNQWARAEYGIDSQDMWAAAIDSRTRTSHRLLNGTLREKDGYFHSIDGALLEYPADEKCEDSAEVYNCRCALTVSLAGYDGHFQGKARKERESEYYQQWLNEKPRSKKRD